MPTSDDGNILHEQDVEDSVLEELEKDGQVGHTNEAIANANGSHALNAVFSDTEVEGALNDLAGTINDILAALRINGIVAPSS
jgi:hypothetical protein